MRVRDSRRSPRVVHGRGCTRLRRQVRAREKERDGWMAAFIVVLG